MALLGLPAEKVKVRNKLVGGGFGGKEDVTVQHHAGMIAYLTKRPVKVKLTREESILIHPKRHPMDMEFTLAVTKTGSYRGKGHSYCGHRCLCLFVACAAARLHPCVLPYNYQNFDIDGKAYYTNNPPAGAFRGFGVTQTCFAIEMLLTKMAEKSEFLPGKSVTAMPSGRDRSSRTAACGQRNGACGDPGGCERGLRKPSLCRYRLCHENAGVGVGLPDWGRCRLYVHDGRVESIPARPVSGRTRHGAGADACGAAALQGSRFSMTLPTPTMRRIPEPLPVPVRRW